jgi:polysaccharide export outer membrane protein
MRKSGHARRPLGPRCVLAAILTIVALPSAAAQVPAAASEGEYLIGPEDVLDVAVWNSPEITRTVPVRPDGKISLPLVNDVQAGGLTPMQLRAALMKALATYIPSPTVSVIVREIHSFKVTVIGEVKTPGRYEVKSRSTVLDLIAMAGGLSQYAARGRIVVLRQDGGASREMPFAYDRLTGRSAGSENFCVKPGDVILVP